MSEWVEGFKSGASALDVIANTLAPSARAGGKGVRDHVQRRGAALEAFDPFTHSSRIEERLVSIRHQLVRAGPLSPARMRFAATGKEERCLVRKAHGEACQPGIERFISARAASGG